MSPRRFSLGFTLTELLIVVLILGILSSMALPSMLSLVEGQRVKSASFEIFAALTFARSEAIKRNSNVTLTPVLQADNSVALVVSDSSGATLRTVPPIKGLFVRITPVTVTSIIFRRTGRANVNPRIQIDVSATPTSNVRCIRLELSGMPRTLKGTCA